MREPKRVENVKPSWAPFGRVFFALVVAGSLGLAEAALAQCTLGATATSSVSGVNRDYVLCSNNQTWATAGTRCAALPGGQFRLVTIDNLAEDSLLSGLNGNDKWTGYNDITTEATFIWTGYAPSGAYVNASFTNNSGANDCVRLDAAGTWSVRSCANTNDWVCEAPPACGNGLTSGSETCDDGNTTNGDGCSATCAVEYGFTCSGATMPGTCTGSTNCQNRLRGGLGASEYVYCGVVNQTWAQASTFCQGYGAGWELTTIGSDTENNFVYNLWSADGNRGTSMFHGCRDTTADADPNLNWLWLSNGTSCRGGGAAYQNWGPGEPNNGNPAQGCGSFWTGVPYQWDDLICTATVPFVCEGPSTCGNGVRAPGSEGCDDGNTTNGDGCSSTCTIESPPVCGNGSITGAEECDDGNTTNADGCSSSCTVEPAYTCIGQPSVCTLVCAATTWVSRSATNATEYLRCTTGAVWGAARNSCTNLGAGWSLTTIGDVTENAWVQANALGGGNRWIGVNDTNTEGTYEWASGAAFGGYINWAAGEPSNAAVDEDCGLMLTASGQWDIRVCGTATGFVCEGPPRCGNGVLASGEACDDGNSANGDGCSSTCVVEPNYVCTNVNVNTPSTCTQTCAATPTWSSYLGGGTLQTTEYLYCTTTVTWTTAQAACPAVGSGWALAKIAGGAGSMTASVENTHISGATTAAMWHGLNDVAVEGTYRWTSDNSTLGAYNNWAVGQPNNSGAGAGSDCVVMNNDGTGTWDDLACTTTRGYVCEGPAICGNGVMASPNGCDDGDLVNGDGCSSTCAIEAGFGCTPTNPSVCTVITEVALDSIAAYVNPAGPGIVIEWVGLNDPTNRGFDVVRKGPSDAAEVQINARELVGTAFTQRNTAYSVVDADGGLDDRYWILEHKMDGRVTRYAEIVPTAEKPVRPDLESLINGETPERPFFGCSAMPLGAGWGGMLLALGLLGGLQNLRRRSRS
ncbi:MAG: lectin-like protein [Myxococcaceae bacterium]